MRRSLAFPPTSRWRRIGTSLTQTLRATLFQLTSPTSRPEAQSISFLLDARALLTRPASIRSTGRIFTNDSEAEHFWRRPSCSCARTTTTYSLIVVPELATLQGSAQCRCLTRWQSASLTTTRVSKARRQLPDRLV